MDLSIKYKGREVEDPLTRLLILCGAALVLPILVLASPILLVVHLVLLHSGRRGFITEKPDGSIDIAIDEEAFERLT